MCFSDCTANVLSVPQRHILLQCSVLLYALHAHALFWCLKLRSLQIQEFSKKWNRRRDSGSERRVLCAYHRQTYIHTERYWYWTFEEVYIRPSKVVLTIMLFWWIAPNIEHDRIHQTNTTKSSQVLRILHDKTQPWRRTQNYDSFLLYKDVSLF